MGRAPHRSPLLAGCPGLRLDRFGQPQAGPELRASRSAGSRGTVGRHGRRSGPVTVGWRVILAGGGTGGHLQPGVAVAEALVGMAPEVRVCFVGTGTPLERQILLAAGYRCHTVPARPLPRGIRQWPAFLRDTLAGYRRARLLLSQQRPAAVVGLGGYASVPVPGWPHVVVCPSCCWNRTPCRDEPPDGSVVQPPRCVRLGIRTAGSPRAECGTR
ncbi:MAG TPA: hypothetical protein EYH34_14745 [Planctomycetes bacterium]|nr:hypothetical protein [Planctomycetota bacterium]